MISLGIPNILRIVDQGTLFHAKRVRLSIPNNIRIVDPILYSQRQIK